MKPTYSIDGTLVKCEICGEFFAGLLYHLRKHKVDAFQYIRMYDLPGKTNLNPGRIPSKPNKAQIYNTWKKADKVIKERKAFFRNKRKLELR